MSNVRRYFLKYFICTLILFLSLFYPQILHAKSIDWQNSDYIVQSFFEVALGSEYGKNHNPTLRKWNKPIRIFVEHKIGDQTLHDELLDAHIKQLIQITQLDIKRVEKKSDANIFYFFTQESNLNELVKQKSGAGVAAHLHGAVCLANVNIDNKNFITSAYIFIPVDQARMHGKLVSCIVEEITQALGLIRDSELVFPSIFNDKTHNALLTGLDYILIRLHNEKRVKAGMSRQQLKPILRSILNQSKYQKLIKSAESRVQRGELYQMLGFKRTNKN